MSRAPGAVIGPVTPAPDTCLGLTLETAWTQGSALSGLWPTTDTGKRKEFTCAGRKKNYVAISYDMQ